MLQLFDVFLRGIRLTALRAPDLDTTIVSARYCSLIRLNGGFITPYQGANVRLLTAEARLALGGQSFVPARIVAVWPLEIVDVLIGRDFGQPWAGRVQSSNMDTSLRQMASAAG